MIILNFFLIFQSINYYYYYKKEENEGFNINNKLNIQQIKINNDSDNEEYLE